MADAAAPLPKQRGPGRWILLGCAVLTGLFILGMGGCAGIFYFVYKGTEPVAEIGAGYLRAAPEMKQALGSEGFSIRRNRLGWNVNVANDGGQAKFAYSILGPQEQSRGSATANPDAPVSSVPATAIG